MIFCNIKQNFNEILKHNFSRNVIQTDYRAQKFGNKNEEFIQILQNIVVKRTRTKKVLKINEDRVYIVQKNVVVSYYCSSLFIGDLVVNKYCIQNTFSFLSFVFTRDTPNFSHFHFKEKIIFITLFNKEKTYKIFIPRVSR